MTDHGGAFSSAIKGWVAGRVARVSDARRIQLMWLVYISALVIFVLSLLEPAASTIEYPHYGFPRTALHELAGWQFFLFGPFGIFAGPQLGWYANPLMLLSALPLKRSLKVTFAALAILLIAVSSVTLTTIPVLDVAYTVRFYKLGFYLWLTCPALLLLAAFLRPERGKVEQIKLVSDDEAEVILEVAQDAVERLGWPRIEDRSTNALLPTISPLKLRQDLNYGKVGSIGKLINYFSPRSISRDDLIILAPYIDDWLSGNIPLFDLPAEYDPRNEFLGAFKKRLLCSGDWPDERAMEEVKPRSA